MAHPDFDLLLNVLIPRAQKMLAQKGEFYPFCATLEPGAAPALLRAELGDERPTVEAMLERLSQGLQGKARAGDFVAAGICLNAWVMLPETGEKSDAIEVRLEHVTGLAVRVFLPYREDDRGERSFGELFAAQGERAVFTG